MPVVPAPAVPSRFNRGGLASALPAASPALEGVTWTYSDVGSATYTGRVDRCNGAAWVMIVPPSGTNAALRQGRVGGNRVFAIGDSITALNSTAVGSLVRAGDNYLPRLCARSQQRLRWSGYAGTAGYTLAQILATHVPTAVALTPKPNAVIVFGGTNDCGAGTNGNGFVLATSAATLATIIATLEQAGITPILVLIPPRGDSAGANTNVSKWNAYVAAFAARNGYHVLDAYSPLVDPATGGYLAGYDIGDGIHPSFVGMKAIAEWNAITNTDLLQMFPANRPYLARSAVDTTNLLASSGLFRVDTNADGLADGWSKATTTGSTLSVVAPSAGDNINGNWQRIARASGATGNQWIQLVIAPGTVWAVGDLIAFSGRFQSSGIDTCQAPFTAEMAFNGSGTAFDPLYQWTADCPDGAFYGEFTVPAGATGMKPTLQVNPPGVAAGGYVQFAEITVRNLTQLGIV